MCWRLVCPLSPSLRRNWPSGRWTLAARHIFSELQCFVRLHWSPLSPSSVVTSRTVHPKTQAKLSLRVPPSIVPYLSPLKMDCSELVVDCDRHVSGKPEEDTHLSRIIYPTSSPFLVQTHHICPLLHCLDDHTPHLGCTDCTRTEKDGWRLRLPVSGGRISCDRWTLYWLRSYKKERSDWLPVGTLPLALRKWAIYCQPAAVLWKIGSSWGFPCTDNARSWSLLVCLGSTPGVTYDKSRSRPNRAVFCHRNAGICSWTDCCNAKTLSFLCFPSFFPEGWRQAQRSCRWNLRSLTFLDSERSRSEWWYSWR